MAVIFIFQDDGNLLADSSGHLAHGRQRYRCILLIKNLINNCPTAFNFIGHCCFSHLIFDHILLKRYGQNLFYGCGLNFIKNSIFNKKIIKELGQMIVFLTFHFNIPFLFFLAEVVLPPFGPKVNVCLIGLLRILKKGVVEDHEGIFNGKQNSY